MDRKKFFKRLAYIIFLIFILHFFANTFHWYSSIWYFDMIMHFLGGFWLGLVFLYFFAFETITPKLILETLLFVLVLGLGWEFFEILVDKIGTQNSFNTIDTISDLFFDLSGGIFAFFYFSRYTMFLSENKVE